MLNVKPNFNVTSTTHVNGGGANGFTAVAIGGVTSSTNTQPSVNTTPTNVKPQIKNLSLLTTYDDKINLVKKILSDMEKIIKNLEECNNDFKNGGCVLEQKSFIDNEIKNCLNKINVIKEKYNIYLNQLEQSRENYMKN